MTDRVVQLHFGRYVHPIYREQARAAPAGFCYRSDHPSLADETSPTKRIVEHRARFTRARETGERVALRVLSQGGYLHRVRARAMPGAALLHSCERLIHRSPLPYVLDFEHAELFVLYQRAAWRRPWTRALLAGAVEDERLRFLLPWSDAARRSLFGVLDPTCALVRPAPASSTRRFGRPSSIPATAPDPRCGFCSSAPRSTRREPSRRSAPQGS